MIYFDNAATTPLHPEVADLMDQVSRECWGNPSSSHAAGRKARVIIDEARLKIAGLLDVNPSEIYFTSTGTESLNLIFYSLVLNHGLKRVFTSRIEHPAVLNTLEYLRERFDVQLEFIPLDDKGYPHLSWLEGKIASGDLLCLMHANNEIGNLLPVEEAAHYARQAGALFLCDMVQTMGKYINKPAGLGVDLTISSAHKYQGPKGIGFAYIRKGIMLKPLMYGGGQERSMRSGTENVAGIAGMAMALELSLKKQEEKQEKTHSLKKNCIKGINEIFPDVAYNGDCRDAGLYSLISFRFPLSYQFEMLQERLDINGICVSAGSACHSGASKASSVLSALGLADKGHTLRVSFSPSNTQMEVDTFISVMKKLKEE